MQPRIRACRSPSGVAIGPIPVGAQGAFATIDGEAFRFRGRRDRAWCPGAAAAANAEGPFDGTWKGRSVTEFGWCPQYYEVRLGIRDGDVTGEMVTNSERITVATTVDRRGRMARVFGYNGRTVLKTLGGRLDERTGQVKWMGHGHNARARGGGSICYGAITLEKVAASR